MKIAARILLLSPTALLSSAFTFTPPSVTRLQQQHRPRDAFFNHHPIITLKLASDDDSSSDDEPLSRGVNSVSWLPSVSDSKGSISEIPKGEILPLFPLGGIVYTPNSQHVLNIFEPRYRQMYNDILMNGSKRFVVAMSHPTEAGSFAQMGVLFQLEDLKEVSEQTNDQVKFVCTHKVTGRVKLHKIVNPEVWNTRETYLKVEGTIIEEVPENDEPEKDVKTSLSVVGTPDSEEERRLRSSFSNLVELQHDLTEDVRFTRASVSTLSVDSGAGEDSLWTTVRLWQSYTDQRLVARQNELQKEFQTKLLKYLTKEKGVKEDELPSAIGFRDLSPALQKEVQDLQKRMAVELEPLVLESTLTMQKILEAKDHSERIELLIFFVNSDRKRLEAKKTLQAMFTNFESSDSAPSTAASAESLNKTLLQDTAMDLTDSPSDSTIFKDEPDAFQ